MLSLYQTGSKEQHQNPIKNHLSIAVAKSITTETLPRVYSDDLNMFETFRIMFLVTTTNTYEKNFQWNMEVLSGLVVSKFGI